MTSDIHANQWMQCQYMPVRFRVYRYIQVDHHGSIAHNIYMATAFALYLLSNPFPFWKCRKANLRAHFPPRPFYHFLHIFSRCLSRNAFANEYQGWLTGSSFGHLWAGLWLLGSDWIGFGSSFAHGCVESIVSKPFLQHVQDWRFLTARNEKNWMKFVHSHPHTNCHDDIAAARNIQTYGINSGLGTTPSERWTSFVWCLWKQLCHKSWKTSSLWGSLRSKVKLPQSQNVKQAMDVKDPSAAPTPWLSAVSWHASMGVWSWYASCRAFFTAVRSCLATPWRIISNTSWPAKNLQATELPGSRLFTAPALNLYTPEN